MSNRAYVAYPVEDDDTRRPEKSRSHRAKSHSIALRQARATKRASLELAR